MGIWFDYIRYVWPILTGIAAGVVLVATLWLNSRFVSRADYTRHRQVDEEANKARAAELARHNDRLNLLEAYQKEPPTRHDLGDGLSRVLERMSKLEATVESSVKRTDREFDSISRQLGTLNDYLQALIEKGLGK